MTSSTRSCNLSDDEYMARPNQEQCFDCSNEMSGQAGKRRSLDAFSGTRVALVARRHRLVAQDTTLSR